MQFLSSMAPKRSRAVAASAEEQAAKLRKRALELQNKGMREELMEITKNRPDLTPLLLQHAYSLGAPRSGAGSSVAAEQAATSSNDGAKLALCDGQVVSPGKQAGHRRGEVDEVIPRCHQTWGSVPPQYIMHFLSSMEPIALSLANLKQLAPAKSKHVPKGALLELFEALCGINPEDPVLPWMRVVAVMVEVCEKFNKETRLRMYKEIRLPVSWSTCGHYTAEVTKEPYQIKKKNVEQPVAIPKEFLATVKQVSELFVQKNWSEREAVLVDPNGFGRVPMSTLFPNPPCMEVDAETRQRAGEQATKSDEQAKPSKSS